MMINKDNWQDYSELTVNEINKKVALEVMGWLKDKWPNFYEKDQHAWKVAKEMGRDGYEIVLRSKVDKHSILYIVSFTYYTGRSIDSGWEKYASRAICIAALRAIEYKNQLKEQK